MKKKKLLIVSANYYSEISMNLENDVIKHIKKFPRLFSNNPRKHLINVPGVFEIPVTISKNIKKYDAFIAIGCVIKGETPHFDFISKATTDGIMKISIESKKPIGNGIITSLNKDQAVVRSKIKGREAVNAVFALLSQ